MWALQKIFSTLLVIHSISDRQLGQALTRAKFLPRSHRDWQDLIEIDEILPRLQRSRRDLTMMFVEF